MTKNWRIRKQANAIGFYYSLEKKNCLGMWRPMSDLFCSEERVRKEYEHLTKRKQVEYMDL